MTANELLHWPEDGFRSHLMAGELKQRPFREFGPSVAVSRLGCALSSYVEENQQGCVAACAGFWLETNPDTVLAPDIGFVAKENLPNPLPKRGYFWGMPDLAVEVVSPSETMESVDEKVAKYLERGTRLIWILRPLRRRIEIHRINGESEFLTEKDTLSGEDVVPGFEIAVNRIFR